MMLLMDLLAVTQFLYLAASIEISRKSENVIKFKMCYDAKSFLYKVLMKANISLM